MRQENQSVSPNFSPVATPSQDRQQALGLGPGRVHRGGKTSLPDNTQFWKTVNAVEFSSRGVTRQEVYRAVAWFVALTDHRLCFAAVETIAEQARLGTTATRAHLRALERDGFIETEGDRSKGRSTTCYRLSNPTLSVANPTLSDFNPTLSVAKEVIEEGTEEEVQAAALLPVPVQEGVDEKPQAETKSENISHLPAVETESNRRSSAISAKPTRHTCPTCGNSWPSEYGETCYVCPAKKKNRGVYVAGGAAPVKGKYDGLWDDAGTNVPPAARTPEETKGKTRTSGTNVPPRPDPPPMTPALRRELEADARARGFTCVGGKWMDLRLRR